VRRKGLFAGAATVVAGVVLGTISSLGAAQVSAERVSAFPMPGSVAARAETQISLRGAPAAALGEVTVTGERSGAHAGELRAHSDGDGASFLPSAPFLPGERVTVSTALDLVGGQQGDFSFVVADRPAPGAAQDGSLPLPTLPPATVDRFRSRRDLEAPVVRINRRAAGTAPGLIFLAPFSPKGSPKPDGPLITDDRGDLVFFRPVKRGTAVTDLKVQRLGGEPVITWWEGRFAVGWGYGAYTVLDSAYREVAKISLQNGYQADLHDLVLTDRGTALLLAYDRVRRDLRFVGGPREGIVVDNVVQEVDLSTGLVLFEWHSLGQVALSDSRSRPEGPRSWDYFHVNSVAEDTDGDLIISARNTCAIYKLDRETGAIVWQLGGKGGDFRMGKGSRFCFQHDARRAGDGSITLFDNAAGPPALAKQSRAISLRVDEGGKRVRLQRAFKHPGRLLAFNQGSARRLPNGNVFVGWGAAPVFSEFTPSGRLVLDGRLTRGKGNYRAVRELWTGRPQQPPAIAAERGRGDRVVVYASWNGATEVARWQVLAGAAPDRLAGVSSRARDGFETVVAARTREPYVAVRALDGAGQVLGTSNAIRPRR
jgi:Arylsulfotransferase (ASST)